MTRVSLLLFAGVISASATELLAEETYWPGWLGPNRDGWVSHFTAPEAWPHKLTQVWRAEVGTGYGSPLVAHGHIYQHARQNEDEVVWCLDLATGEVLWRQSHPVPFTMGGGGERHGKGPKSSPVLADGRLFTMSITGTLSAWDTKTGDLLWQRNGDDEFGKSHPYWGASTSPVVSGDRVFVHFGTDDAGALVALDVANGEEVWRIGDDGPSYSSPLVAEFAGVPQVVEWNHRALMGVEQSTGQFLWEFPFPHIGSDQNMPTPAIHDGRILLGGENRGILGLVPQLQEGRWTVENGWHQKSVALDMSSAVVNDGLLYGFSHYKSGQFFCLDPKTGEILWAGPGRTGNNVMFLAIPGHIVALIDTGELRIFKASAEDYEPVASYKVASGDTWAPPVVLSDGFLVKDKTTLTRWRLPK